MEDVVPESHERGDERQSLLTQVVGLDAEEARLQGVSEGDEGEVAEREHEPETVGGNVHHCQQSLLVQHTVKDVESLEKVDEDERVVNAAKVVLNDVVVVQATQVDQQPQQHPGSQLAEQLDVEAAHARVELPADEPVVHDVAGVPAQREDGLAVDVDEASDVAVGGQVEHKQDGDDVELDVVLVEEHELRHLPVGDLPSHAEDEDQQERVADAVDLVAEL